MTIAATLREAATAAASSPFLSKLLAPLADPNEERCFVLDLTREADFAWREALHRFHAADKYREVCCHRFHAVQLAGRVVPERQAAAEEQAWLDFLSALNALMLVPAPTIGALRIKQKRCMTDGGRDRWEAAIAADETRLGVARDRGPMRPRQGVRDGADR